MYKSVLKPLFFLSDPEKIHYKVFSLISNLFYIPGMAGVFKSLYGAKDPVLRKTIFGLTFDSPVGLAAGFDKNALLIDELSTMGFGFVEIGTVTPKGQAGNDKPRLFRLPEDEAVINRMGFNNVGTDVIIERLKKRKSNILVGGNIGKNKVTPNEEADLDYEICFKKLFDYVDYFVVNVSSPNTPNLRALQEKEPLQKLLSHLVNLNKQKSNPKPILLKIAPDLTDGQLDDIIEIVKASGIDGVVATNTTISRADLKTDKAKVDSIGMGGLSGKPVKARSTEVIRYLSEKSGKAFPIIGVGGIFTAEDAIEKLEAGADLVQVYTGFIYEGPAIASNINKGVAKWMKSKHFDSAQRTDLAK